MLNIRIVLNGILSLLRLQPGILAFTLFALQANATTVDDLLSAHNSYRQSNGAPALCLNSKLLTDASNFCSYMAATGDFSHYSRNGSTPTSRLSAVGYNWYTYGENIALGYTSVNSVMTGWENSPGHNQNILEPSFRQAGFASCQGAQGIFWVAVFAASSTESCSGSSTTTTTNTTTTPPPTNNTLAVLAQQQDGWFYLYQQKLYPPIFNAAGSITGWKSPLATAAINSSDGWCYIYRGHLYRYTGTGWVLLI